LDFADILKLNKLNHGIAKCDTIQESELAFEERLK